MTSTISQINGNFIIPDTGYMSSFAKPTHLGYQFIYLNDHSIKMQINNVDGKARIMMFDGSASYMSTFSTEATCSLTASGPGGLQVGSTEAANTGYYVFAIAKASGTSPELMFVPTGSNYQVPPTPVISAPYNCYSNWIFYVSNNTGSAKSDILRFSHHGDHCRYIAPSASIRAYENLNYADKNDLDFTGIKTVDKALIPPDASSAMLHFHATNLHNTNCIFEIYHTSSDTDPVYRFPYFNQNVTGDSRLISFTENWFLWKGLSGSLCIEFDNGASAAPLGSVYVRGWNR